jgi:hypothetical protein
MWCRQCQQDVPVLAPSDEGRSCCPRCGLDLGIVPVKRKPARACSHEYASRAALGSSATELDAWNAEEQLRHIERTLRIRKKHHRRSAVDPIGKRTRIDATHHEIADPHHAKPSRSRFENSPDREPAHFAKRSKTQQAPPARDSALLAFLTWTATLLGAAALLGGGIALAGSILGSRPDYWNYGLPFAVGGQIVLLVGSALQLDRVWRAHRSAAEKLDDVDKEIHDLKTTAALLGMTHSPTASAFYAHFAGGANAQLLLADLKSQLDLLAIRIARDDDE